MSERPDIPDRINPRLPGGYRLPPFGVHQFLALSIVAVALWSLGAVWLGMQAAQQWVGSWQGEIHFHVYLPDEKAKQLAPLEVALKAIKGVASVRTVSQQDAARWVEEWLGATGMDLSELAKRLPTAFEISVSGEVGEFFMTDLRDAAERFGASLNDDELGLAQAHEWLQAIESLVWFASSLLALAMALIISNTLRMTILARVDEVRLMRLLGAAEWFVRMPFVLEGIVLGAGAGLAAWLLTWPLIVLGGDWLASMAVDLNGFVLLLPLVLGGALTGCLGAWIATTRLASN